MEIPQHRRFRRPKPDNNRKKVLRAIEGAAAGGFLALFVVAFGWDLGPPPEDRARITFEVVAVGVLTGGALAAYAGSRRIRGKPAAILRGGAWGMAVGSLVGACVSLALFRHPDLMLGAALAAVIGGGIIGAGLSRRRFGGRVSLAELMVCIALFGAILAIFLRMPP